jgi:hypothetical protein
VKKKRKDKKKLVWSRRVWISTSIVYKPFAIGQNSSTKTHKNCCHVGIVSWLYVKA